VITYYQFRKFYAKSNHEKLSKRTKTMSPSYVSSVSSLKIAPECLNDCEHICTITLTDGRVKEVKLTNSRICALVGEVDKVALNSNRQTWLKKHFNAPPKDIEHLSAEGILKYYIFDDPVPSESEILLSPHCIGLIKDVLDKYGPDYEKYIYDFENPGYPRKDVHNDHSRVALFFMGVQALSNKKPKKMDKDDLPPDDIYDLKPGMEKESKHSTIVGNLQVILADKHHKADPIAFIKELVKEEQGPNLRYKTEVIDILLQINGLKTI
jgi:hypothetical protein